MNEPKTFTQEELIKAAKQYALEFSGDKEQFVLYLGVIAGFIFDLFKEEK